MAGQLSWSLIVPTYNRMDTLCRSLPLAARQTRPPLEIIVVDASLEWTTSRARVMSEVAVYYPAICWKYVPAQQRSVAAQRNQGIRLSQADIAFLLDDDSLMYPDCAESILRVYEADETRRIVGVMADDAGAPPDVANDPSEGRPKLALWGWLRYGKDRLLERLAVRDYLLTYDHPRPSWPLPPVVARLRVLPRERLHGAWMTCRREWVEREPFEEALQAYSYLEDCDFSYRLARHGTLLLARDARIYHLCAAGGRLTIRTLAILGGLNALVLHRLHSSNPRRSKVRYRSFLFKQWAVQAARDLIHADLAFPRSRGVLCALHHLPKIFARDEAALRTWYMGFQAKLLQRDAQFGSTGIGYLVPEFPGQTHAFFWREIQVLRQSGVAVHLLSSRRPPPDVCRHEFAQAALRQTHYVYPPRWLTVAGVLLGRPRRSVRAVLYILRLHESPWGKRLRNLGLLLAAADLFDHARRHGYGHLHVHSCADTAHVAALAVILGGPGYSLTLHGDLPVYGCDHARKMTGARFVACVTTALGRQVRQTVGLPIERTPILWMGVDTDRFQANGVRIAQPNRLHLVTVARLNPAKGHCHALAAMRKALDRGCNLHYTIAGEGSHRGEIEAAVRRLGLMDRVNMPGTLSESQVCSLLQRADAFVLPSVGRGEAAPVSIMEAMAAGLPVIASIIGGTPDMISSGVDGLLVEQGDEQALAEALVHLARNPPERVRLGQAARQRAVQAFDVRNTAARFLETIRGTMSDRSVETSIF